MRFIIKEGDFAICLRNHLFLRRPRKNRKIKTAKSGNEIEIWLDVVRKTEPYFMKPCLNSKKFALLLAKKARMNLSLITESDGLAICCFVSKSRRPFCRGFFIFCYNV